MKQLSKKNKYTITLSLISILITFGYLNFKFKGPNFKSARNIKIKRDKNYYKTRYENACCPKNKIETQKEYRWLNCQGEEITVQCIDTLAASQKIENLTNIAPESCERATKEYLSFLKKEKQKQTRAIQRRSIKNSKKNRKLKLQNKKNKNIKNLSSAKSSRSEGNNSEQKKLENAIIDGLTCNGKKSASSNLTSQNDDEVEISTQSEYLLPCAHVEMMKSFYDNNCLPFESDQIQQAARDYAEKNNKCSSGFCFVPDNFLPFISPTINYAAPPYSNPLNEPRDFGGNDDTTPESFEEAEDFYTKSPKIRLETPGSFIRHIAFNYGILNQLSDVKQMIRTKLEEELNNYEQQQRSENNTGLPVERDFLEQLINQENLDTLLGGFRQTSSPEGLPIIEINPIKGAAEPLLKSVESLLSKGKTKIKFERYDFDTITDPRDIGSSDAFYNGINFRRVKFINKPYAFVPEFAVTWKANNDSDAIRIKPVDKKVIKIDLSSYPNHLKLLPIDGPNGFNQPVENNSGIQKKYTPKGNDDLENSYTYFNLDYNMCTKLKRSFIPRPVTDFHGVTSYSKAKPRNIFQTVAGDDSFSYDTTSPPMQCECADDKEKETSWCLFDKTDEPKYIQIKRTDADILKASINIGDKKIIFYHDIIRWDKRTDENFRLKVFQDLDDVHILNNIEKERISANNQLIEAFTPNYLADTTDFYNKINYFNPESDSLYLYKKFREISYDIKIPQEIVYTSEITRSTPNDGIYLIGFSSFLHSSQQWNTYYDQLESLNSSSEGDPSWELSRLGRETRSRLFKSLNDGNGSEYIDKKAMESIYNELPQKWKSLITKFITNADYYELRESYKQSATDIGTFSTPIGFFGTGSTAPFYAQYIASLIASSSDLDNQDKMHTPYFLPFITMYLGLKILEDNPEIFSNERLESGLGTVSQSRSQISSQSLGETVIPGLTKYQDMEFDRTLSATDNFPYWALKINDSLRVPSFQLPNTEDETTRDQIFSSSLSSQMPLKSFALRVGCKRHHDASPDFLKFSLPNRKILSRQNINDILSVISPDLEKRLFNSEKHYIEKRFRKALGFICQGLENKEQQIPQNSAQQYIGNIRPIEGENRSTYHNSFASEIQTNIDMGKYALILGSNNSGVLGEFDFEFTFLTEIEESIKKFMRIPVFGWIAAVLLAIYWVVAYIYTMVVWFFVGIGAIIVIGGNGAFGNGQAWQNISEAREILQTLGQYTHSYDFKKVKIKVQTLTNLKKDIIEDTSTVEAKIRRYRINKSDMIITKTPWTFSRPENASYSSTREVIEQRSANADELNRSEDQELSQESFNTATDYSFDFFSSSIQQYFDELVFGRRSPVKAAVSQLSDILESDLYLITLIDSANKTIHKEILGVQDYQNYSASIPENISDPVNENYNSLTGRIEFTLFRNLCSNTGPIPPDNNACVIHQLIEKVRSNFSSVNNICINRIGIKTHHRSLDDISFDRRYVNDDYPPLRFCSDNETYTSFERDLYKKDDNYGVSKSDIVLKSFNDIKLQLERPNYPPSIELEELRKRSYPIGSDPTRYPWQMQCALFTDLTIKGTNHLNFESVAEIPDDDPRARGDDNGALKLDINVDIFPHLSKSTINKINDIFLCKHNRLCQVENLELMIEELEEPVVNNDEDEALEFIEINGVQARTLERRAKEAQCSMMTDLWLRLRVENTIGATPIDDIRYCNFSSIFGRDENGEVNPLCNFRVGLMGLLFNQCDFIIRTWNEGLEDDDVPRVIRESGQLPEGQCQELLESEELERYLQRLENIANECSEIIPGYNSTFERKLELIQLIDIEERRANSSCEHR